MDSLLKLGHAAYVFTKSIKDILLFIRALWQPGPQQGGNNRATTPSPKFSRRTTTF